MLSKSIILTLKCPKCNKFHSKTDELDINKVRRLWQELVYQKDVLNNSDINLCCGVGIEYYIQGELARKVLFTKR